MADPFANIDFWEDRYGDDHTPWDLGQVSAPVRALVREHFPERGAVIVPGCGRGYEALYLAERGYAVAAVDFVEAPIRFLRSAAARRGLPVEALEAVQADIFALPQAHDGRYDVFLEQTCLCALMPSQWQDYEALAWRLLKPGGRVLGVFMEMDSADGPPYDCPPERVRELFSAPRWSFEGMARLPDNPDRPGPEYTARFRKSGPA